jgi:REP element-mobilizing transposase RayT
MAKKRSIFNDRLRYKDYAAGTYHHLTSHAIGSENCFRSARDYALFLRLLNARLTPEPVIDEYRKPIRSYHGEIELVAFCLMRNHIHLLIKQIVERAMASFMDSLLTSYAMRFNNRHERVGPLFMHPYSDRPVPEQDQLRHVAEYIHLNPFRKGVDPFNYRWSSHRYFAGLASADWCNSDEGVRYFGGRGGYLRRMHDATTQPWSEPFD